MEYSFDIDVAKEYGVNEAILIKNFQFWILKNRANNKHFYDERTWTYNSATALSELYPFWTGRQIAYILDKLEEKGVIIKGHHSQNKYDRTLWVAFNDEKKWIGYKNEDGKTADETPFTTIVNQENKNEKSLLTDINTYIKPDINTPATPVTKKGKSITKKKERLPEEIELFNKIKKAFEFKYGEFENYKKEGSAIYRLIDLAKKKPGNNLKGLIHGLITEYYKLTETGNSDYWQKMPFLPSWLSSSGIFPQVYKLVTGKYKTREECIEAIQTAKNVFKKG